MIKFRSLVAREAIAVESAKHGTGGGRKEKLLKKTLGTIGGSDMFITLIICSLP